jgi:hypothetical protein
MGATKRKKIVVVEKTSARVIDKNTKILEKAQVRKESTNKGEGTSKLSFSAFESFTPQHFVNVATSCGIKLSTKDDDGLEVMNTMVAQERAQAVLTEARLRKEREAEKDIKK